MKLGKMQFKIKKWMVVVIVGAVLAAGGGYYAWRQASVPAQQPVLPPVKASSKIIAEGKVIPVNYSVLSFSVSGIVAEVLVTEGDKVEAGQVLVKLECKELQARYRNALAELAKAQAKCNLTNNGLRPQEVTMKQAILAQQRALCAGAEADFERTKRLFERGAVSQQQFDKDRTAYLKAQADLQQAEADLEMARVGSRSEDISAASAEVAAAQAKVQEIQANIVQTELRAPFSGTIASIDLKPGEFVTTETAKIDENAEVTDSIKVQLADLSKWQIKTHDLTEINIARVTEGAPVTITFDALPGVQIPGKVTHIRAYGEKKRGDMTYAVFIEPLENDARLRWNMTASVSIEANDTEAH